MTDGRTLRAACESADVARGWVATITGGDRRFDVCIAEGSYPLAQLEAAAAGPAHDVWLRLEHAGGGGPRPPGLCGCLRLGMLLVSPTRAAELAEAGITTASEWFEVGEGSQVRAGPCPPAPPFDSPKRLPSRQLAARDDYGFALRGHNALLWRSLRSDEQPRAPYAVKAA